MAWEENPRICLHMQLIAILSRTGVHNYEWINTMTSNVFTSTSIFRKVPGNLLFSIAYKL